MPTAPSNGAAPVLNIIPNNGVWPDGVPPVMGAHLMASGTVAPVSTSKGAGDGVAEPMFAYPTGEGDTQVVVYATPKNAAAGLARMVTETAAAAIKAKGSFTLVLSGAQQQCACVCVCVCVCVCQESVICCPAVCEQKEVQSGRVILYCYHQQQQQQHGCCLSTLFFLLTISLGVH